MVLVTLKNNSYILNIHIYLWGNDTMPDICFTVI